MKDRAPDIRVEEAFSGANLSAVQDLCRLFRLWLFERYPEDRDKIDAYYNPDAYEKLLADLPVLHGPPDGTILLAKADKVACGCVMLSRVDATRCEMKRLFVDPGQRGTGAGSALCEALLHSAKTSGYETMVLDTGPLHHEAKALYVKFGFSPCTAYYDPGVEWRDKLLFMQRDLR